MRWILRRSFLSSSASLLGGGMIAGQNTHAASEVRHHIRMAEVMAESANRFLAMLRPEQKTKAIIPFDDEERMRWFYAPVVPNGFRVPGLALAEMSPYQKYMAHALLASGLSQAGYIKAVT